MKMQRIVMNVRFWMVVAAFASGIGIAQPGNPLPADVSPEQDVALGTNDPDAIADAHDSIHRLYHAYLGREPDTEGLHTYTELMVNKGKTPERIAEAIRQSPEAVAFRAREQQRIREAREATFAALLAPYRLVSLNLAIAIASGLMVALAYSVSHRRMNDEIGFRSSLALLAPIVSLMLSFVRVDWTLSIGLIGSLSIIRFRTPFREPGDAVYLLWSMVSGLGAGVVNGLVVLGANAVLVVYAVLCRGYGGTTTPARQCALTCLTTSPNAADLLVREMALLTSIVAVQKRVRQDGCCELAVTFCRSFPKRPSVATLCGRLRCVEGVAHLSLHLPTVNWPFA